MNAKIANIKKFKVFLLLLTLTENTGFAVHTQLLCIQSQLSLHIA